MADSHRLKITDDLSNYYKLLEVSRFCANRAFVALYTTPSFAVITITMTTKGRRWKRNLKMSLFLMMMRSLFKNVMINSYQSLHLCCCFPVLCMENEPLSCPVVSKLYFSLYYAIYGKCSMCRHSLCKKQHTSITLSWHQVSISVYLHCLQF